MVQKLATYGEDFLDERSPGDLSTPEFGRPLLHSAPRLIQKNTLAWTELAMNEQLWKQVMLLRLILEHYLYGGCNKIKDTSKLDLSKSEDRLKWQEYLQVVYPGLIFRELQKIHPGVIPETIGQFLNEEILRFAYLAKGKKLIPDLLAGYDLAIPIVEGMREVVGPGWADDILNFLEMAHKKTRQMPSPFDDND